MQVQPEAVQIDLERDDRDQVELTKLAAWARRRDPVRWTLGGMIALWSLVFIVLCWQRHERFATFGFDLGVYDQAVWLLSRFKDPFITVRGLDLFGFHMNVVLLFLAPFYWFGAGPEFLLLVQVAAQASGAIAIYLLARDRLSDRWLAVGMAGVLLLNPTYQYLVWEFFHPDSLAIAPLFFAYWAGQARRWGWFAVAAGLALACKEDVGLALAVMGVIFFFRGSRRAGVIITGISLAWFALSTRVILPAVNGVEAFYNSFFGEFGSSPGEILKNVVTKPGKTFDTVTLPDRMSYYEMMFAPVAFLPLAAPLVLVIAGPMLAINVLSTFPYQREIRYHYAALVLVGIMLATVEAIARLGRTMGWRRFLVGMALVTSFGSSVAWGPSPLSVKYHSGLWPLGVDDRHRAKEVAISLVPEGAPTSAIYYLVPHLTRREKIYEFPVPWASINWGVAGENLHDPAVVEWIVTDRTVLSPSDKALLDGLIAVGEFAIEYDQDDIVVAKRLKPPASAPGVVP